MWNANTIFRTKFLGREYYRFFGGQLWSWHTFFIHFKVWKLGKLREVNILKCWWVCMYLAVVYFDIQMGAVQPICWLKSSFQIFASFWCKKLWKNFILHILKSKLLKHYGFILSCPRVLLVAFHLTILRITLCIM